MLSVMSPLLNFHLFLVHWSHLTELYSIWAAIDLVSMFKKLFSPSNMMLQRNKQLCRSPRGFYRLSYHLWVAPEPTLKSKIGTNILTYLDIGIVTKKKLLTLIPGVGVIKYFGVNLLRHFCMQYHFIKISNICCITKKRSSLQKDINTKKVLWNWPLWPVL